MQSESKEKFCPVCDTLLYKNTCIYCNDDNKRLYGVEKKLYTLIDSIRKYGKVRWREKDEEIEWN